MTLTGNAFLDALPPATRAMVLQHVREVPLDNGVRWQLAGEPAQLVLFPLAGAMSGVRHLRDGAAVEVRTAGTDGLTNDQVFLQTDHSTTLEWFVQVAGRALAVDVVRLLDLVDAEPLLGRAGFRHVARTPNLLDITLACAALHRIDRRLARWLLRMSDRAGSPLYPMTQEVAAVMLGVRRPSVTRAIASLEARGCVRYSRGRVEIVDRDALVRASCECYEDERRLERAIAIDLAPRPLADVG